MPALWALRFTIAGERLAIVSVHPDAVVCARGHAGYGSYSLYLAANVDPAVEAIVRKEMREAPIAARFSNVGIDPQSAESMLNIAKPDRPLRDQALLARVALGESGHSVIWPVEELDMGADTLWQYALDQNGRADAAEFIRWRWRNRLMPEPARA